MNDTKSERVNPIYKNPAFWIILTLSSVVIGIASWIVVSLVIGIYPLFQVDEKTKWSGIDRVAEEIDYQAAGKILNESKQGGSGALTWSVLDVTYSDTSAYDYLLRRSESIETIMDKCTYQEESFYCEKGYLEFNAFKSEGKSFLKIKDHGTGTVVE